MAKSLERKKAYRTEQFCQFLGQRTPPYYSLTSAKDIYIWQYLQYLHSKKRLALFLLATEFKGCEAVWRHRLGKRDSRFPRLGWTTPGLLPTLY